MAPFFPDNDTSLSVIFRIIMLQRNSSFYQYWNHMLKHQVEFSKILLPLNSINLELSSIFLQTKDVSYNWISQSNDWVATQEHHSLMWILWLKFLCTTSTYINILYPNLLIWVSLVKLLPIFCSTVYQNDIAQI